MMKKQRTDAQRAGDRKRCLNGVCKMTKEERYARKRIYRDAVLADPFRRAQYRDYYRKRREKPGMRERTNAQARTRYAADPEAARAYSRAKYKRMMADPVKHAEHLARRRARRHGADGKMTAACKRTQIRTRLIPRWTKVVDAGRDETYMRRTTPENARLFRMWRDNYALFEQMMRSSYGGAR